MRAPSSSATAIKISNLILDFLFFDFINLYYMPLRSSLALSGDLAWPTATLRVRSQVATPA